MINRPHGRWEFWGAFGSRELNSSDSGNVDKEMTDGFAVDSQVLWPESIDQRLKFTNLCRDAHFWWLTKDLVDTREFNQVRIH
jgi:hypothetical protein